MRSTLVKIGKKSLDCVGGSGYHIKVDLSIFYSLGPYGPREAKAELRQFFRKYWEWDGMVLEKIVKVEYREK